MADNKSNWMRFCQDYAFRRIYSIENQIGSHFAGRVKALFRTPEGFILVPEEMCDCSAFSHDDTQYCAISIQPEYKGGKVSMKLDFTPKHVHVPEDSLHAFRQYEGAFFEIYKIEPCPELVVIHLSKSKLIPPERKRAFNSDYVWTGVFKACKERSHNPHAFSEMVDPKMSVCLQMFDSIVPMRIPHTPLYSGIDASQTASACRIGKPNCDILTEIDNVYGCEEPGACIQDKDKRMR